MWELIGHQNSARLVWSASNASIVHFGPASAVATSEKIRDETKRYSWIIISKYYILVRYKFHIQFFVRLLYINI